MTIDRTEIQWNRFFLVAVVRHKEFMMQSTNECRNWKNNVITASLDVG